MRAIRSTIPAMILACSFSSAWGQEMKDPAMMKPDLDTAGVAKKAEAAEKVDVAELFRRLDADGDKVVTATEVSPRARPVFVRLLAQMDTNGDGNLDEAEVKAIAEVVRPHQSGVTPKALSDGPPPPAAGQAPLSPARFKASDANGDGKLSRDEFQGPPARFKQVDVDNDGFITEAEAVAARSAGQARFKAMDKDKDGKISFEEFEGQPVAFDSMDANSDGYLTGEEIARFMAKNAQGATPAKPAAKAAVKPAEK